MAVVVMVPTFGNLLDELAQQAVRSEVPAPIAENARALTERALRTDSASPVTSRLRRRAEAYFSAVMRRAIVRGSAGSRASARLVVAAVVADLQEAGRDAGTIWSELERGWADRVPADLLEEYRLRLRSQDSLLAPSE